MDLKRKRGDAVEDEMLDPDMSHFCMHARHSWLCNNVSNLKMPCDFRMNDQFDLVEKARKGLLKTVGVMPPVPRLEQSQPEPLESQLAMGSDRNFSVKALHNAQRRSWSEQINYDRKCAYRKWIAIVSENVMAFEVARLQMLSGPMEFAKGGLAESIHDALGNKSSSTLHARAGPLLRYIKFYSDRGVRSLPLEEYRVYDFIKAMQDAAPSFPRSFLLSVSFATHILGLIGGMAVCDSKRIDGAVKSHYEQRAKVRQRPPLTVAQVKVLEHVVNNTGKSVYDRVMAGYFLLLVYGRLRFSDGQRITGMRLEMVHVDDELVGFLECAAERTKTSVSLERKVRFLPIAVPVQSLTSPPWLPVWNQLRLDQGLTASGYTSHTYPVMPAPAAGGGWSQSALGVTPAGEWLRNLLRHTETVGDIRLATHSCKATLLSWCSKVGVDHDSRRLLGYHTASSDKSLLVYSRDAMAQPLRALVAIIEKVVAGSFNPDTTRSGMFAPAGAVDDGCSSSASSSCGSEDEDDKDLFEEEKAVEDVAGKWQPPEHEANDEVVFVRHLTSRCIHKLMDEAGTHLSCGRAMSARYEVQPDRPKFFHPLCGTCFKDSHA